MNPYAAPITRNTETSLTPSVSRKPTRPRAIEVLLPAIIFTAGYLATAGGFQSLYEGLSSGLNYVKTLVFDFPQMFLTLFVSYAILRSLVVWSSLRPSIWFTFASAVLAYILFPLYYTPIYAVLRNVLTHELSLFTQGFAAACVGIAIDSLGSTMISIVRQRAPGSSKMA